LMKPKAPHSHASSPGLTGRPSIPETPENSREAAAYWIVRSSRTTTVVLEATKQSKFVIPGWCVSVRPQMRNCASGNLEIPGSMLRIAPE
jgi:hypothetical protein